MRTHPIVDEETHERRRATVYGAAFLVGAFLLVVILGLVLR